MIYSFRVSTINILKFGIYNLINIDRQKYFSFDFSDLTLINTIN